MLPRTGHGGLLSELYCPILPGPGGRRAVERIPGLGPSPSVGLRFGRSKVQHSVVRLGGFATAADPEMETVASKCLKRGAGVWR